MATGGDVLSMLRPEGGWLIRNSDYDLIEWIECDPVTKADFEAGFAQFDAWKAQQDLDAAAARTALLTKLGITEDEAKLLLS
jgi:hypothetical protein